MKNSAPDASADRSGILPWTKSCFVCGEANPHGLHLKSRIEGEWVVTEHTTREADLGWRHIVHGGIAMTLLDEVMTWAAILASRRACVAAEMTTRLRKPIHAGQRIRAQGRVTDGKSRLFLTEAQILDVDGTPLATATGKYVPMPEDQVSLCEKDFVWGAGSLDPRTLLAASETPT
jgi:uncharacterized protein (TIGR00369 family)